MKRTLSICLTLVLSCLLILGNIPAFAAEHTDYLKNVGLAPAHFGSANSSMAVTRGEFAYMAAGLLTKEEITVMDTRFSDVDKNDYYSGRVELLAGNGVINGYGDGTFGENDPVTMETAYIILMRALGYANFINQSNTDTTYQQLAAMVGLEIGNYTGADGYVTKGGAVEMIYDALTAELANVTYKTEDDELIEVLNRADTRTILADTFGISVYEGVVTDVDMKDHSIEFTVTSNRLVANPVPLSPGEVKTYLANENLNIYEYNQTPVTVWVNEDDELVHINLDKDVTVKYVNILSVNGDGNTSSSYGVNYINRMTFLDDEEEYDVSSTATYKFNGKMHTGSLALAGKYARVVLTDNEVTHVESWDLQEGGLITEIGASEIRYVKGSENRLFRNLNTYETVMYFIGGRHASAGELKTNSVFYYYVANDYLVFVVSEKIITDTLESKADDGIQVGNSLLKCGDALYYKIDTESYKRMTDTSELWPLFGNTVNVYVAPTGKALYVKPDDGQSIAGEFYGAVVGIEMEQLSTDEGEIELLVLREEVTRERFKLTKKTKYNDDLSLSELESTARDLDGNGIYTFKTNAEGNITGVFKPTPYYGYNATSVKANVSTFVNLATAYVDSINGVSGTRIYFQNSPVTVLYESDGEFMATRAPWEDLRSRSTNGGATLTFYGKDKSSKPSLIVLSGISEPLSRGNALGGVVIGKSTLANEDGDIMCRLTVATSLGKEEYVVTPELANTLPINTFIRYATDLLFCEDEIYVRKTWDVSAHHDLWVDESSNLKMVRGVVDAADDERIYFDDGTAVFMHPSNFQIMCVDESSTKARFDAYSVDQLVQGDVIYYQKDTEGIKFILAVK